MNGYRGYEQNGMMVFDVRTEWVAVMCEPRTKSEEGVGRKYGSPVFSKPNIEESAPSTCVRSRIGRRRMEQEVLWRELSDVEHRSAICSKANEELDLLTLSTR